MTSTKMDVVLEDEIRNLEIIYSYIYIYEIPVFLSKTQRFAEEMCVCFKWEKRIEN